MCGERSRGKRYFAGHFSAGKKYSVQVLGQAAKRCAAERWRLRLFIIGEESADGFER
jgi:hypothetical protein